jgi:exonuclease V
MRAGGSGVLGRLGKSSILVTDIANQFWCERQMEYNYLYGKKYTKYMAQGKQLHEALQDEVYVPLTIEPVNYEDYLYKTAYENYRSLRSLKEKGICREFRVYGSINGYRLSGQIDEMKVVAGKVRVVERKTTDAKRQLTEVYTRPHIMQVMLYRKMLGDIKAKSYTHENFAKIYGLTKNGMSDTFKRELHAMGIREGLIDTNEMFRTMFEEINTIPDLSDRLEVVYLDRFSGNQISSMEIEYNEREAMGNVSYAMKFWNGERESAPVVEAEKWKCNFCKFFGKECKVWWKQASL